MGKQRVPRTRCSGTLTEAQYKGRHISTLRRSSQYWKPKNDCLAEASKGTIINPKTGRPNKAVVCSECSKVVPKKDAEVDHIVPVVPLTGWDSFDGFIERLFCEKDGFRALCEECHSKITKEQNAIRRENKKRSKE